MKKSEAIDYINKKISTDLNNQNTIFSNPGSSLDLWWLEPANDKLKTGFYFISNNANTKKLLLFKIPKGEINKSQFRQREDINKSQIIIPVSETSYIDRKGFNFNKFLIETIDY
jgi:hypothetical protein